jgi:hypothetical protein
MFYALVIQMTDYSAAAPLSPLPSPSPLPPPPSLIANATTRNDKRERKQTAQLLPPGITHNMMKKFVVYYREMTYLKNGKQQIREYFKVESHPRLNKPWVSSKSMKIPLLEKLNDANQYVVSLDTEPSCAVPACGESAESIAERWSKNLPKYTMLRMGRHSPTATILTFVYDRKDNINGFRWTCSHTFSCPADAADAAISLGLHCLRDKLREKYGADLLTII